MKNMSKVLVFALACLLAGALLTGCMNSGGRTLGATPTPGTPQNSAMPGTTGGTETQNPAASAAPYDWTNNARDVQDKINQLSEIQKSTVVVTGKTALVGVTFTGSYAGELTQRIHDMVAAQVQSADASIEKVAVTSDKEDVRKIEELASKIQSGTPASDLEQEIDSIARNDVLNHAFSPAARWLRAAGGFCAPCPRLRWSPPCFLRFSTRLAIGRLTSGGSADTSFSGNPGKPKNSGTRMYGSRIRR